MADPCAGVECRGGQVCNPETGECATNECSGVTCPVGDICVPETGDCVDDPCQGEGRLDCPAGTSCEVAFDGTATCADIEGEFVFAGGSGCGCQATDDSAWTSSLLILGALLFAFRRRHKGAR